MNIPAIISIFRIIRDPPFLLPHHTLPTFASLPIPVSAAFKDYQSSDKPIDIRAVVLDKDNCFAVPHTNTVHPPYQAKFQSLIDEYSASNVLVVSNSSGLSTTDPAGADAALLERNTGVTVLRHNARKPGCKSEVLEYFEKKGIEPGQICVIGDRLFTDVVMGNSMGAWSIWIKEGVASNRGFVTRAEYGIEKFLRRRGYAARRP